MPPTVPLRSVRASPRLLCRCNRYNVAIGAPPERSRCRRPQATGSARLLHYHRRRRSKLLPRLRPHPPPSTKVHHANPLSRTRIHRPTESPWRLGYVARTVCPVSERVLVLLLGVVVAAGLAGLAVVTDDPLILAVAAAVAFVSVGYVLPARGLPLFIVRRQPKPPGVARAAFVFTLLGIFMVWATTIALDATDSYIRLSGWIALAFISVGGATIVAAIRYAEGLKSDPIDEPRR
jgi:hypothetical protein